MLLTELFDPPVSGYQDVEDDHSVIKWRSSRKTKLTLKQIHRLRRMLDIRNYEKKQNLASIRRQYGPQQTPSGGGFGF